MSFFSSKSRDNKRRADIVKDIVAAFDNYNFNEIKKGFTRLTHEDMTAPEMPYVISGTIERVAFHNFEDSMRLASYALDAFSDRAVKDAVSEKALALLARADKTDMKQMAGVALMAARVVDASEKDSEFEKRGLAEWKAALKIMADDKKEGLQYAFAVASNAAVGARSNEKLTKASLDFWEATVVKTAESDLNTATTEIGRVTRGYGNSGPRGEDIRTRAIRAIGRIDKKLGLE